MGEGVFSGHRALVLRKEETRLHGGGGHPPKPLGLRQSSLHGVRNQDILASSHPGGSLWNSLDVTAWEVPV